MSQVALANAVGISASYLSQIEAAQRPLTHPLVLQLAEFFSVKPDYFAEVADLRLAADLREAGGDPFFTSAVSQAEASAVVRAAAGVARAFLDLYRAYLALEKEQRAPVDGRRVGRPGGNVAIPLRRSSRLDAGQSQPLRESRPCRRTIVEERGLRFRGSRTATRDLPTPAPRLRRP
jgi:transcriptional regulator with XRE-family HTH domain